MHRCYKRGLQFCVLFLFFSSNDGRIWIIKLKFWLCLPYRRVKDGEEIVNGGWRWFWIFEFTNHSGRCAKWRIIFVSELRKRFPTLLSFTCVPCYTHTVSGDSCIWCHKTCVRFITGEKFFVRFSGSNVSVRLNYQNCTLARGSKNGVYFSRANMVITYVGNIFCRTWYLIFFNFVSWGEFVRYGASLDELF